MPNRNVAVWNAIITGYNDNGHQDFVFDLFRGMWRIGVSPDNYTFASVLSLYSTELLDYGRHIHLVVIKSGFFASTSVVNSLITMYFNCNCVVDACVVFEEAEAPTLCDHITYNAMIDGLVSCNHRRNEGAFIVFRDMQRACFSSTELTFVSVMSSCSSMGVGCKCKQKQSNLVLLLIKL